MGAAAPATPRRGASGGTTPRPCPTTSWAGQHRLPLQIWPAELLGYNGQGAKGGAPGDLGVLNLPTEVVSSEFLTMEGKKFSSSHGIVIYVR